MSISRRKLKLLDSSTTGSLSSANDSISLSTTADSLHTTYGILCEVFAREVRPHDQHQHRRHHHHDDEHEHEEDEHGILSNYMILSLQELFDLANKMGNDEAGERLS